jgi:putative DNA methylase
MIEKNFDIAFIADLALREKQIQQNYRPIIAVHKWFARRPGTLFRGLLLAEFAGNTVRDSFYRGHALRGPKICDPFMGCGTPLLEANRAGCDVVGFDINPMAHWIVREEIEHIDLEQYREAAQRVSASLESGAGHLYRTRCLLCDSADAHVKYFLWVKVQVCSGCRKDINLFPGYMIADDTRHPNNVFVCERCGELSECKSRRFPGACSCCGNPLTVSGPARRNRCKCSGCGTENTYPNAQLGPPRHRMFAIEYHCAACKPSHSGRFFKKPDAADLQRTAEAESIRTRPGDRFIPTDEVPAGDESDRLHRWGYRRYSDMFNERQLTGLEYLCLLISQESPERIRRALATNFSDLLRYQNMLCRYDTMALKSLDIFSIHGFPVGLIQCESNLLGITSPRGLSIGSGGWTNIVEKYAKAKAFCEQPFDKHRIDD